MAGDIGAAVAFVKIVQVPAFGRRGDALEPVRDGCGVISQIPNGRRATQIMSLTVASHGVA